ncbi:MAG: chemotaxis protein CheW [Clostridia bacterium]|nr:chemotaxis protein CheW [Clostridia bacterium]MDD4145545.1 chemotaxis protein CheW [Clostridia bacterium]MDD4664979.1 chemotaxis protein CheW [Clostridia bacterium]
MENQFIALKLSNEEYAVDILAVKEIIRWTHLTRVPKAPFFIQGVLNLRGNVIPVINSHLRLQLSVTTPTEKSRIIILNVDDLVVGFIVDEVIEVITLSKEMLEKPQLVEGSYRFIKNIGKINDRVIIILDLDKIVDLNLY